MEIFPFDTWNSAIIILWGFTNASWKHVDGIHGFYFNLSSILAGFLKRSVNLHPEKVKKCYSRFENGVRKETIEFTNTSGHWSSLSSDALGTKINLHAPITIAAFRNFCPKCFLDKNFKKQPLCYTWKVVLSLFGQKFWKMINNSIVFHCLKA